jgi:hypothetical protein
MTSRATSCSERRNFNGANAPEPKDNQRKSTGKKKSREQLCPSILLFSLGFPLRTVKGIEKNSALTSSKFSSMN